MSGDVQALFIDIPYRCLILGNAMKDIAVHPAFGPESFRQLFTERRKNKAFVLAADYPPKFVRRDLSGVKDPPRLSIHRFDDGDAVRAFL